MIVASVILFIFVINALFANRLDHILARAAGLDRVSIARRGAVWRYRVASLAVLTVGACAWVAVLIHSL
jgi:hypothetical protein